MKKEGHVNSPKIKRIIVILLFVLLLVTALAYGFMLGTNYSDKNNTTEEDNKEIVNDEEDKENEVTKETVTKEEIENFLSLTVNGNPYYNLFEFINNGNIDDSIFISTIKYLIANNKYTKSGDTKIFNQSDIKEVARKYHMKDNFDYIPTYEIFVYNSSNQTFSVNLQVSLFGHSFTVTKGIQDYTVNGNEVNVNYNVTVFGTNPETGEIYAATNYSYAITMKKTDNELRILNVVKNQETPFYNNKAM